MHWTIDATIALNVGSVITLLLSMIEDLISPPPRKRKPARRQDAAELVRRRFQHHAKFLSEREATQGIWNTADHRRHYQTSGHPETADQAEPPSTQPDAEDTAEARKEREALINYERARRANQRKEVRHPAPTDQ